MSNSGDLKSLEHSIDRIRSVEKLLEQVLQCNGRSERTLENILSTLARIAESNEHIEKYMQKSWSVYEKLEKNGAEKK